MDKQENLHKREAAALLIIFSGVFFTIALLSYTPVDGGFTLGAGRGAIEVHNWFGKLGAFLAGPIFNYTFGYFSIPFALFLIYIGGIKLFGRKSGNLLIWLGLISIWSFWGSALTGLIFYSPDEVSFYPAGMVGAAFAASAVSLLGVFGAWFLSFVMIVISAVVTFKINLSMLLKKSVFKEKKSVPESEDPVEEDEGLLELIEAEKKLAAPAGKAEEEVSPRAEIFVNPSALDDTVNIVTAGKVEDDEWNNFVNSVFSQGNEEKPAESGEKVSEIPEPEPGEDGPAVSPEAVPAPEKKRKREKPKADITAAAPETEKEPSIEIEEAAKVKEVNYDKKTKSGKAREYKFPSIKLLAEQERGEDVTEEELVINAQLLEDKLADFNIEAKVVKAYAGPVVTMFELRLAPGIKISKVTNLAQDLAMGMQARGIRIIAPIPGKATIGIEIPNRKPQMVRLRSLISSKAFADAKGKLVLALGKTVNGEVYVADLGKMPHLLIAGTTGSGKSVGINTIIASILYRARPDEVKFVMIDPKMLELSPYQALEQHHLAWSPELDEKVVTKPENAVAILNSVVEEMDRRYHILSKSNVRKLDDYNAKLEKLGVENMPHPELNHQKLPFIVVIIDELADLMITASKEVEQPIARLAQMARAVGIHLIVATQRPSVDVLTGVIKANFPTRLAYQVAQKNDSRTILDMMGAEQLLGNGDMLFLPPGEPKPIRLQNGFISTEEVENIITHISRQPSVNPLWLHVQLGGDNSSGKKNGGFGGGDRDQYFEDAKRLVVMHQQGSVSLIQRRLKVGYARAARIMDQLEEAGVVGPFEGSKARDVLLTEEDLDI